MKNYIIRSLSYFTKDREIEYITSNPNVILLLILQRVYKNFKSRSCTKTRLAKICAKLLEEIGKADKDILIPYRHGYYPIEFQPTIEKLQLNGYLKIEELRLNRHPKPAKKGYQIIITKAGLKWLDEVINEVKLEDRFSEITNIIDYSLYKNIEDLSSDVAKGAPYGKYKLIHIGENTLSLINDWLEYADGIPNPYHYTLLHSYYSMGNYFENLDSFTHKHFFVDYDKILDVINSSELEIKRRKFSRNRRPLSIIFEKQLPKYLLKDKYEGKNYIKNTWYLIEAINIIHAFESLAPSLREIAYLSLVNLRYGVNEKMPLNISPSSYIKNDINNLYDFGLIEKIKSGNEVRYKLVAKNYYDEKTERDFEVMNGGWLKLIFEKRIKKCHQNIDEKLETDFDDKPQVTDDKL